MESQLNSAPGGARALAIFPGALGDFVCFLPALCELARVRGVDLCARSEYGELLPEGIHAQSIERREIARLFVAGADLRETAAFFGQFEIVYSWSGSGDAVFRANFARAAGSKGRLFPFRPAEARTHISDYYLACAGAPPGAYPKIAPKPDALEWARAWLRSNGLEGERLLVVAPGSGANEKNWPREYFHEVIEWWTRSPAGKGRSPGGKVSVVLGPAEDEDYSIWAERAAVACGLSLGPLAELLSMADVYVGNDSGVTHLAAAAGAKTIALFGPTAPAEWAPRGRDARVISLGVECSPCDGPAMKICPHRKCLTTLKPRDIIALCE